jgi:signal transduction histidine kinase/tetratricopeptide (TPR) repeat protein
MFDNFKSALIQHKKFLAIYFVVVFLPSLLLAVFGIRAIANERYKLRQKTFDEQRAFLAGVKSEVTDLIDKKASSLEGLASSPAFREGDLRAIRSAVIAGLQSESLVGEIVIWRDGREPWLPALQERPPDADPVAVPDGWRALGTKLKEAETWEFARRDFSKAISLYRRLLDEARDRRVEAWLLNRIARCEAKRESRGAAFAVYRSLVESFSDLPTESGRPLELAARLELLDVFLADHDMERFCEASLAAYSRLQANPWSLGGAQFQFYANMLREKAAEALASAGSALVPAGYRAAIENHQEIIEKKISTWRLAGFAKTDVLPGLVRGLEGQGPEEIPVLKTAFAFEGDDVLAFVVPLDGIGPSPNKELLGELVRTENLRGLLDPLVSRSGPAGVALLVRSNLTGRVVESPDSQDPPTTRPVLTDVFQGSFLPWQLELYPARPGRPEVPIYSNIFSWIILALLIILFIGSGLVVRTIVQEANLLKLKSDFVASVSHEFKTPLTAMGAILEHLLSGDVKDPARMREYIGILRHDSDRLKRLVKNVLDFSKIEDGKREYRPRPTDVVQLVEREVRAFEKESGIEGLRVGFRSDDNVPLVPLDEEAIGQALHNILDNAVKFSPRGQVIDVELRKRRGAVEIAVQDRGIGIPENEQKKIFEKFYRGKQAAVVSPTGTGLGLALVRHIVDAHHGDVIVQSRPGEGCRVSLILPVRRGEP